MANDNLPNRLDRLKGPRPIVSGESTGNGASPDKRPEDEAPKPVGPPQGSEEWRRLYETIRDATGRLRS